MEIKRFPFQVNDVARRWSSAKPYTANLPFKRAISSAAPNRSGLTEHGFS